MEAAKNQFQETIKRLNISDYLISESEDLCILGDKNSISFFKNVMETEERKLKKIQRIYSKKKEETIH